MKKAALRTVVRFGSPVSNLLGLGLSLVASAGVFGQTEAAPSASRPADLIGGAASPAATDPRGPAGTSSIPAKDTTVISVSPYIWLPSFSGTQTLHNVGFDIDASFTDILDKSDKVFGLMGAVDIKVDRLVFQFNGAWSTAEFSDQRGVFRNRELAGDLTTDIVWLELFAGYRIVDTPIGKDPASRRRFTLDGFVGGRATLIDASSTLTASADITLPDGQVFTASRTRDLDQSENWVEPFLGLRLGVDITEGWSANIRGDVGGFGLGSDFAWQAAGMVGYRWHFKTFAMALYAGYRALGQDYSDNGFGWDMTVHGPAFGLQFSF